MVTEQVTIDAGTAAHERVRKLEAAAGRLLAGKAMLSPDEPYGAPVVTNKDFCPAPDLSRIAGRLIDDYAELEHLRELQQTGQIIYLWKSAGGSGQGKATLGRCVKTSGLVKHFSGALWCIWLAADWINLYSFTRRQVEAALYHELLHADMTGEQNGKPPKPLVTGHDCEMFMGEVNRYGLWRNDLKIVAPAFEQAPMFDE